MGCFVDRLRLDPTFQSQTLRLLTSYAIIKNEEEKLAFANVPGNAVKTWNDLFRICLKMFKQFQT